MVIKVRQGYLEKTLEWVQSNLGICKELRFSNTVVGNRIAYKFHKNAILGYYILKHPLKINVRITRSEYFIFVRCLISVDCIMIQDKWTNVHYRLFNMTYKVIDNWVKSRLEPHILKFKFSQHMVESSLISRLRLAYIF